MKKSKRGGKREGAGRPTKIENIYRVRLDTTVHPDTLKKIDEQRADGDLSRGELIDNFFIDKKSKKEKT